MKKYTIGIDFGSLSGRALVVSVEDGEELASAVFDYPHAVMDEKLPSGRPLGQDWALQYPQDYIDVLANTVPKVVKESGITPEQVVGLGIDFTSCTVMPVLKDGTPLCNVKGFEDEPHAYVKLWKHHAAQSQATRLNQAAIDQHQDWLPRYGGKISSEWVIPKLWQIYEEKPEICRNFDLFVEAGDWVIWQMTGKFSRTTCTASFKAIWSKHDGFPKKSFFESLQPGFGDVVEEKLQGEIKTLGDCVGYLTPEMAGIMGLKPGIAVSTAHVDAHVTVPALGIDGPGKMLAIMGTSTCHMILDEHEKFVPGMCGVAEDGVMPGFFGYEAGQSCVGDHFAWCVDNLVPPQYYEDAKAAGIKNMHAYLRSLAEKQRPGEHGLVALDWWNGNRSVLVDVDLTGLIVGMTLHTRVEDIYRALIEATAYGTRKIIESFRGAGVAVNEFYASGGIAWKDPMTMQIYADIIKIPVRIAGTLQGPALGSAIYGAVAAGEYKDIFEGARKMGKVLDKVYYPIEENSKIYDKLYAEYETLHDYFGRGANDVMKRLKKLKSEVSEAK